MGIAKEKRTAICLVPSVCQSGCKEPSHPVPINSLPQFHEVCVIVIPHCADKKLEVQEVKKLAQGHTANR